MTTYEHEMPLRLLQDNPKFAEELYCGLLGRKLPDHTDVKPGSEAMTRGDEAVVRNCDNVAVYYEGDKAVFALLFEAQLRRDDDKEYTWLDYIASARTRLRCPVALVVITFDESTARWAMGPFETGHPALALGPLVIGPDLIPLITNACEGRENLALMLLSLIAHASGPQGEEVMTTYRDTIRQLDRETWSRYAEYAINALRGNLTVQIQEIIMGDKTLPDSYRMGPLGERYQRGRAEGRVEAERDLLNLMIERLEVPITDTVRLRIDSCDDPELLHQWADQVLQTRSTEHVLD